MKSYSLIVSFLLVLVMVLASFGCQPTPAPTMESLRVAVAQGPLILDPILSSTPAKILMQPAFDWLVGQTLDANDISKDTGIASDWKTSEDLLSWTFSLRKGIQFQEGWGELTAVDVKFSIERVMGARSQSAFASSYRNNIKSIDVIDPYTVAFRLKAPWATLSFWLSPLLAVEGAVVPKKYIDKVGDEEFNRRPIGSGPYKVTEFVPTDRIKYTAVDKHWLLGVPRIKELSFHLVPESATAIAMLKRGAIDIASVPTEKIKELETAGFRTYGRKGAILVPILFHEAWKNTPLGNVKVRQAIALAINKQEILDTTFQGRGRLASGFPAGSYDMGYGERQPFPYDPQRAKQLLTEAGYPNGFDLTIIAYPRSELAENVALAEIFAGYLQRVGINTKISLTDYGTWRKIISDEKAGVSISILSTANRPFNDTLYQAMYHSKGSRILFKSPEFDALIDRLMKAGSLDEYKAEMAKVMQYGYDNIIAVPLLEIDENYAVNPKITDWKLGKSSYDLNIAYLARQSDR